MSHSGFYININNKYGLLIDPFIKNNPLANFDYKKHLITHIFVTHAHGDHLGCAIEISKNTKAPIFCIFELANYCLKMGANAVGVNLGGEIKFEFGSALFLNAQHSSSCSDGTYGGCASSILFNINGNKILHLGDTSLHSDLKLYGDVYNPETVLCPIGGFYTMGIDDAVIASKMLNAKNIIPIHYNTFTPIRANAFEFKEKIENINHQKCIIMDVNQEIDIKKIN